MFFALELQVKAEHEKQQYPVIPVLLKGALPQAGFLFLNTWVDFRETSDAAEALEALIRAITLDERSPMRAASSVCPYLGLRAFREEDQAFYFGREAFFRLLVEKVAGQPIVAVVGPSGSGKSSVVLAGLIPRLRRQRPPLPTWDAVSFTPGDNPWWRLAHPDRHYDLLVRLNDITKNTNERAATQQSAGRFKRLRWEVRVRSKRAPRSN